MFPCYTLGAESFFRDQQGQQNADYKASIWCLGNMLAKTVFVLSVAAMSGAALAGRGDGKSDAKTWAEQLDAK